MSLQHPIVGIVGATGAVGAELIACLETRAFPLGRLRLFASDRSAGRRLLFRGEGIAVEQLNEDSFPGIDIALFSAGSAVSRRFAPIAVRQGTVVVDNSSAFRMEPAVPLVVPEVNPDAIARHIGVIANPNCVAIVAVVPLWPLHRHNPVRRVVAATYQAASGAGAAAMEELRASTAAYLQGAACQHRVLAHPYAFNLFSHDTRVDPATGYNEEETKVMRELRKIMDVPDLRIGITCVRVPVLRAHSIALTVEFERAITPDQARAVLADAPGVRIVDDVADNHFPMPIEASGQNDVLVGRIRRDVSDPSGCSLAMFVAGDQLLKGAALNAVQIAERLIGG
jgi:aspartate-semialdehyde dehydrogenase